MQARLKISIRLITILLWTATSVMNGQILKDTLSVRMIKKDIGFIYNYQFAEAKQECENINKLYPGHPVTYLLKGMITYWENYPMVPTSRAREVFEDNLRKCIDLCEEKSPDETEYILSNLCARGLLLLYLSENNLNMEVIPLAGSTYKYIRRSFDLTTIYPDFFFFTGIYNYTREAFPEAYPIYKPAAILFPRGNKVNGINELQTASVEAIFLKAESLLFLSSIFLKYESNYTEANYYIKRLNELYSENIHFKVIYIKNLLLLKEYDKAERLLNLSESTRNNSFFDAELIILKGILLEKKYNNFKEARQQYLEGANEIASFGEYGHEFTAYAYFGLSRISKIDGDKQNMELYRKEATELADIKGINFD